jgi:2-amino-4-hydroxy-6-hydroxymethyldihydropteridine diphosphokinase
MKVLVNLAASASALRKMMPENTLVKAYIALGSNMAMPAEQLSKALQALSILPQSRLLRSSSFYASKPMGPQSQPDYVNAVAELYTSLSPLELLRALQGIELQQGRERKGEHWGPRTLDLDILLYGSQIIEHAELVVPHYGMKERPFVLVPLAELTIDLVLPCGTKISGLVENCDAASLEKLNTDNDIYIQTKSGSV